MQVTSALTIAKRLLRKPDGRHLTLYARDEIDPSIEAPSPEKAPHKPSSHLRWHPLRGEWVAYATHRQNRTFLPPPEYDPLAPTTDPEHPTEVPAGKWDVAVFENLFPTLTPLADEPPDLSVPTRPGKGSCEVVVYTQDARSSLAALPLWHVELLLAVWADRTRVLGAREDVAYVFPFENRGEEIGVTLHHPHGQIYAYPFVPPAAQRELEEQRKHFERTGQGLLASLVAEELREKTRLLYEDDGAVAFVPICARWAYEIWIAPKRAAASLPDLDDAERASFARALKTCLMKLDALFARKMPYILLFHQAPTDGEPHPEAHVHVEIYPFLRMKDRLKYLAGSELGAGVFTADTAPEEKVKELQAVEVRIE
jgi:UDPglucose--hexose-1-phosphate uridylyltransferase